jgi:hypothetical protein
MPNSEPFVFFIDGQLHGDHHDATGEYQTQFENIQQQVEGSPLYPKSCASNVDEKLNDAEQQELEILRKRFEPLGVMGDYHADHSDDTGEYSSAFERYLYLIGEQLPELPPISPDGQVTNTDWRNDLSDIIKTARARFDSKV